MAAPTTMWPNDDESSLLETLRSPADIQNFLDVVPYSTEPVYRCPRDVARDRLAHCFDGAVFAAAALERLGHAPLILDLRAVRDDDHVLAIYRQGRHYGALSKSNVVMLRSREPLFRGLRELVLSYFDFYYNLDGEKTLREYSRLIDLRRYERIHWRTSTDAMETLAQVLDRTPHTALLTPEQERALTPVDRRTFDAGLLGADWAGLYKPGGEKG